MAKRESQHKHYQPEITKRGWTVCQGKKHQSSEKAESLVEKGKMLQEIWGSVCPAGAAEQWW